MRKRIYNKNKSSKKMVLQKYYTKITPSSVSNYDSDCTTNKHDANIIRTIPASEWPSLIDKLKKKRQEAGVNDDIHVTKKFDISFIEDCVRFSSKEDPLSAFNIFVKCIEEGLYPPSEVLLFISNKFTQYLNSNNSLDFIFEVSQSAKNDYNYNNRDLNIVTEIDTLKHYFGINQEDAIEAVMWRLQESGTPLGEEAIKKIYYKGGKKLVESSSMYFHDQFNDVTDDDDEIQKEFLENILLQYPTDFINRLCNNYPLIKSLLCTPIEKLEPAMPSDYT